MSSEQPTQQRWEQPQFTEQYASTQSQNSFTQSQAGPTYEGPIVGVQPHQVVAGPPTSVDLLRWRRLVWPLAFVVALLTGAWAQAVVLAIVVNIVLGSMIRGSRRRHLEYGSSQPGDSQSPYQQHYQASQRSDLQ